MFKKYKILLVIIIIVLVIGGIGYIKIKAYSQLTYPSLSIRLSNNLYSVNKEDGFLYKTNINTQSKCKLSTDKVDDLGIIVFKNKLYFVNEISKKLCSIDLNGENMKEMDTCNIIKAYQPLFKLGVHIYYYNNENNLIRMDDKGVSKKIAKGSEEISVRQF